MRMLDVVLSWVGRGRRTERLIALIPAEPNTLYAGTADINIPALVGRVYKSTDAGASWSAVMSNVSGSVWTVAIDPALPDTVYAGAFSNGRSFVVGDVYQTTDGGGNWNALTHGLTNTQLNALAIDPTTTPGQVYAGTWGGLFILQDVAACPGDCNLGGSVTVDELLQMVNIALGNIDASTCEAGDSNSDNKITVDEILTAVNNALNGCAT